jgi:putative membrane protein
MIARLLLLTFISAWLFAGPAIRPSSDTDFMNSASQANLAEIQAGKIAAARSSNASVRSFADRMVADHTAAQTHLIVVAQKAGVSLVTEPDTEHQTIIAQLTQLSGLALDSAYLQNQLLDHQVTITLFQQESATGKDSVARSYAAEYLPKLRRHLAMVKKMSKA